MAAEAAARVSGGEMTVATDDAAPQKRDSRSISAAPSAPAGRRCRSPIAAPRAAWRTVSITGVPKADLPAESNGYAVTRSALRTYSFQLRVLLTKQTGHEF